MRDDFAVLILTHGRPDNQVTLKTLRRQGYTGKAYLVIDDEDETADQYREKYGDMVVQFCKADAEGLFDIGDNFTDRRAVVYARNASFGIARGLGLRYFLVLDDDYGGFYCRFDHRLQYGVFPVRNLDAAIAAMLKWYVACPRIATLCMSQGGDHMAGASGPKVRTITATRKAMNSFLCDVERPFAFSGRINEDATAYTEGGRRGVLFLTAMQIQLNQLSTQQGAGGLTDIYLSLGTYVKSFYSVMFCPSAVKVSVIGNPRDNSDGHYRIHHKVDWKHTTPMILREKHRRVAPKAKRTAKRGRS